MRNRFIGAIVATRAILLTGSAGQSQQLPQLERPARIGGHPNFNGIWQALNTANWNLEAHSAEGVQELWRGGAITAIPAGKSMLKGGGAIPYLSDAVKQRN